MDLREATRVPHERVAATVVQAHRLIAGGAPEPARALLQAEIDDDRASPVDHAWLHLQLARAYLELADLEQARDVAARALTIGATQPHDVTATAIRGTAGAIIFNSAPFGDHDVGTVVEQGDTAVGWWRSQTVLSGTTAVIEIAFDQAIQGATAHFDNVKANNALLAAATQSGLLGSHGHWRSFCGLLARQQVIPATHTTPDPGVIAGRLLLLRQSGDEQASVRATAWFVENGPADAVTVAARAVDLARATSGSIFADLAVLEAAGDTLEETTATAAAEWLFAALDDPARFLALTHRVTFDPQQRIAQHLIGILQSIPRRGAELTVTALERHGATFGTLANRDWSRLLRALPESAWTPALAERLAAVVGIDEDGMLRAAIRSVLMAFDSAERDVIVDRIVAGELHWTRYVDSFERVCAERLNQLIGAYAERVTSDLKDARNRELTTEVGIDAAHWLATALLGRPDDENWTLVAEVLGDPSVPSSSKRGTIIEIALNHERIAPAARAALATAIEGADRHAPVRASFHDDPDIAAEVRYATYALTGAAEADAAISELAQGNHRHRVWAARLAADAARLSALGVLAADRDPRVRGEAARGLAQHAAHQNGGDATIAVLEGALGDRGRATGLRVALVLTEHPQAIALEPLRALLVRHPCAAVRELAGDRLDRSAWY